MLKNNHINELKLFLLSMGGETDIAYKNGESVKRLFENYEIKYKAGGYPAGRTFLTWRHDLLEYTPLLFR